jgi:hypothetical protein
VLASPHLLFQVERQKSPALNVLPDPRHI